MQCKEVFNFKNDASVVEVLMKISKLEKIYLFYNYNYITIRTEFQTSSGITETYFCYFVKHNHIEGIYSNGGF